MQSSSSSQRIWRVAEAKARLSEVLRLAEEEGPQRIGTRNTFVVVPEKAWNDRFEPATEPRMPLGKWLVQNMPREIELELPDRASKRKTPFIDDDEVQ